MPTWKRILLKAAGFGAGAILMLSIVVGVVIWYTSRPPKPRPWNRNAITAQFYRLSTTGDNNTELEFEYVLENKTEKDYELQTYSAPKIAAKLEDTNSLTGFGDEKQITLTLPVFVPAHQRTRISIVLPGYGFVPSIRPTNSWSPDEWHKYHAEVLAYVAKNLTNLNGFVMFDDTNRYEIDLPKGWSNK